MDLMALLHDAADAVTRAVEPLVDRGEAGTRAGQHHTDLAADAAVLEVLLPAGVGVLSEESGLHHPDRELLVVVDPVDGSTNAALGLPWWATSLCVLDRDGPLTALVVDQATGARYEATRGGGARRDGAPIRPRATTTLADAIVGLSDLPPRRLGWKQFRAMGAIALDLCAVADGRLDGYVDCSVDAHGGWDYLGALLVCREAGAVVSDALGRDLVVRGHEDRRTPVAGATAALHDELLSQRQSLA
ncbi:MAG: inositol monophosphatase family protein [Actinomycetota bacterium]